MIILRGGNTEPGAPKESAGLLGRKNENLIKLGSGNEHEFVRYKISLEILRLGW